MSFSKSVFNADWANKSINPDFAEWVREVPQNPFSAYCLLCKKIISLSNMGKQALTSHAKRKKHKLSADSKKSSSILDFASKKNALEDCASSPKTSNLMSENKSLSNFLVQEQSSKAEILWALKLVASHSSFNAFNDIAELFTNMFTDSEIAKKCTLGRTKMSYIICYGLAPFFQQSLQKSVSNKKFVVCFDEALNRISQKCQMDLIIRYWCDSTNRVSTRYWNSVFLRRTTAQELFENFKEVLSSLDIQLLLQISMDGPNVNLKFLKNVKELLSESDCKILDLGTCGLHIIHGALQHGHKSTAWKVDVVLRAMYGIFKDSPARRANFMEITGSSEFPLKFCSVRWVENVNVCERALKVFDNVKKYIEFSKKALPGSATCENIVNACQDKLILAKISFFSYIANILQPFLKKFQTSEPMIPFLYENLFILVKHLMKNIIKSSIIEEAKSLDGLFLIDLDDPKNLRLRKNTDIGIVTTSYLNTSGAVESEKNNFLAECFLFVKTTTKKIFERMSKNFAVLKAVSCLNPYLLKNNPVLCEKRMVCLLQLLYSKAQISPACSERAKIQFEIFLEKLKSEYKEHLYSFNEEIRLDDFYFDILKSRDEFSDFWGVVKIILVLSHGNAAVESGFSINKDMLVENLKEDSLVGLRTVYDAIKFYGGVLSIPISKDLLQYVKLARVRYYEALEKQKKVLEKYKEKESNKRKAALQIKLLQKKKIKLITEKSAEVAEIDAQIHELAKKKF